MLSEANTFSSGTDALQKCRITVALYGFYIIYRNTLLYARILRLGARYLLILKRSFWNFTIVFQKCSKHVCVYILHIIENNTWETLVRFPGIARKTFYTLFYKSLIIQKTYTISFRWIGFFYFHFTAGAQRGCTVFSGLQLGLNIRINTRSVIGSMQFVICTLFPNSKIGFFFAIVWLAINNNLLVARKKFFFIFNFGRLYNVWFSEPIGNRNINSVCRVFSYS